MSSPLADLTTPRPQWDSSRLDLDAYLHRINYDGPLTNSAATLRGLHRAHATSISFENIEVLLDSTPVLDVEALQDKLVRRSRGGYCYEHNLLFAAVLERLGFPVVGQMGRIRMGSEKLRPRSHALLRVEAEGRSWIADVGFGGEGLLDPLILDHDSEAAQRQSSWTYRLRKQIHGERTLQSLHSDGWFDLYSFSLEPLHAIDYVSANHYLATHPHSPFRARLVVQRNKPDQRHQLLGREFISTTPDGIESRRELTSLELRTTLREVFGIILDDREFAALSAVVEPHRGQSREVGG